MNTYVMIFKNVLEISLFASIMIAVIFLIKAVLGSRIGIKAITFLWLLVTLRLCLPVMVESPVHLDSLIPDRQAAQNAQAADIPNYEQEPVYGGFAPIDHNTAEPETNGANPQPQPQTQDEVKAEKKTLVTRVYEKLQSINLWNAVSIVWLIGAVLVFLVSIEKSIAFSLYSKKHSKPINDKKFLVGLDILKIECGISRKVSVSACKYINMPVMYGIIRPHILLPAAMKRKLNREHMDAILMHELCHIKNWDILKNYAFLLGKAIHWFNPLVWIAQKAAREDTELLCDQNVLAIMGEDKKGLYSQSLVEATRFVIERKTPMLTISLCENKSNLKERIMHMLRPQKKLKSAGVISVLTAILMIIGCFTTACQPAPDTTIEYDGSDATVMAAAENDTTQTPTDTPVPEDEPDFTQYEAPETFAKTYEKDSLLITVNADVEVPEVPKLYKVKLTPYELDQELADMFLDYFIGDAQMYMRESEGEKASTLENEIANWKQVKYNAENNWDEVKDHDPYQDNGGQQGAIDYIQDVIDRLEEQLENAPQEYGYETMSRQLKMPVPEGGKDIPPDATQEEIAAAKAEDARVAAEQSERYANMLELLGYAKVDQSYIEDKMAYIYLRGDAGKGANLYYDNANSAAANGYYLGRDDVDELGKSITFSLDEAIATAQQAMEDLGVGETSLESYHFNGNVKNGELIPCYVMNFTKSIYGVPVHRFGDGTATINQGYTSGGIAIYNPQGINEYLSGSPSVQSMESLNIIVDDSGVVKFTWDPVKKMEILEEYTDIMSFGDIISVFDEKVLQVYSEAENMGIVINKISLSMLPVIMEGSDETVTIPVWDFRGYSYDPANAEQKYEKDAANTATMSFLTINALDGSLVDR
jgi:beta-lactamase regulating signal transducer with metallopeptidase domain